jgi:hypothetical protein
MKAPLGLLCNCLTCWAGQEGASDIVPYPLLPAVMRLVYWIGKVRVIVVLTAKELAKRGR